MKIHEIVDTRAAHFGPDVHEIAPDPTGGAYSAPPDPLAALRRPTSKGRGGMGRGREGKGKGGEGKGGEGKGREGRVGRGGARPPRILGLEPPLAYTDITRVTIIPTHCHW